ncbi:DUF1990 family protein [Streptomyces sp. NPDC001691]|uniref:DUF1990 family protein n=1 Tax=unclassified Streptomyces TaxID=2593676 RepID=UPI000DE8FA76|nr:DUF1990 domain-containing protein [Streptomyces sp. SDr-06]RCH69894.1 DUF1990 domain-containing protein [Streptomyces sp. SDr-06]
MVVKRSLRAAYARARAAQPCYPEVGATGERALPGAEAGYRTFRRRIRVGYGQDTFERAGALVLAWGAQRGAGFGVRPAAPAVPGATVLIVARPPGLPFPRLVVPCRVVWTVRAAERIGFAYGTLPGHPECGEEAFVVGREADGLVWFEVMAFSRPARWYARLGGPLTRLLQDLVVRRYLLSVAAAVREGPP